MISVPFNLEAAEIFRKCAEVLRQQAANPFRVNAYVRAAQTLESLQKDARDILRDDGVAGLIKLPAIGQGLAASIEEIARTGRLAQLDRLRGETAPEILFRTVPGIGPKLAHAIHDELHVDTLEALEVAAHDGRLATVEGIGDRRAAAIQAGLAALLGRGRARRQAPQLSPPVEVLLDVDREYRQSSAAGELPKIAPKRFNPEGLAWLPILHTDRGEWHFTALFSNTARAHELGRTDDWVVVYFYNDDHQEGQNTIVTETKGALTGERVIRGREAECRALRAGSSPSAPVGAH
jgi:putative hydrolase